MTRPSPLSPRRVRSSAVASTVVRRAAIESLETRLLFAVPDGFVREAVVTNIGSPTAMTVAPDGRVFVAQQDGQLRVIKNGQLLASPFVTVNTTSDGERGLLGVAIDPNFSTDPYVYVYYTSSVGGAHNRVSRFRADGDVSTGAEQVLLDQQNLSSATNHNGGAMHFGLDGKLYVAVGENANASNSQKLTNTFGKILRVNSDGSIPTDNPFYSQTTGVNRAIWALGLRNPFTFAVQPGTGKTYINDVGHNGDIAWEEIDLLSKGGNYGWPGIEGPLEPGETPPANYQNPVYAYQHGPNEANGQAITGGVFYNPPGGAASAFPDSFTGDYFFQDLANGWIHVLDANGATVYDFATEFTDSAPVDMTLAVDGSILVLQRGGDTQANGVYRIRYTRTQVAPPSISQQPDDAFANPGQSVTFKVNATGAGTLGYQWYRDGDLINGATASSYTVASPQLSDDGAVFKARVSNAGGFVDSADATLTVTTNLAPTPRIDSPSAGSFFVAGQSIDFSGSATDSEDGDLAPPALTWRVDYITGGVVRPFVAAFSGTAGGSFTPATSTPYLGADVAYRIVLTATDSGGRSTTVSRDVPPVISNLSLATNVSGLKVELDGNPQTTPFSTQSVAGLVRQLNAPASQTLGGATYRFDSWSDGGAATHDVSVPTVDTTYTAIYKVDATTPQTLSLRPLADTWASQMDPNVNYGGSSTFTARQSSSVYGRVGYLSFDLSSASSISSGILKLYGMLDRSGPAVDVGVYRVADTSWSENGLTWNNRPTLGALIASGRVDGTAGSTYSFDLTSFLQAEKAAGRNRVSVGFFGRGATSPVAVFNSDEAASHQPLLQISGTTTTPPPASGVLAPLADSWASQMDPNVNYGASTTFAVRKSSSTYARVGYLTFDLSAISSVGSSVLRLFGKQSVTGPGVNVGVYAVADTGWAQSGLTWNNRPSLGGLITSKVISGTTGAWYNFDLTSYLKAEKAAGRTRVSVGLFGIDATSPIAIFNSAEAASNRPALEISTGTTPPPPTAGTLAPSADSWASQADPNVNYGASGTFTARRSSSVYGRVAYLTFDLSTIGVVGSASLELWGRQDKSGPRVVVGAFEVADTTWTPSGLTWSNRPSIGQLIDSEEITGTTGAWYRWDMTAYVQSQKAAGRTKVSIGLFGLDATSPFAIFNSNEAGANKPRLVWG